MVHVQALATLNGVEECLLVFIRPNTGRIVFGPLGGVAVVEHQNIEPLEVLRCQVLRRCFGHFDRMTSFGKQVLNEWRGLLPSVVFVACNDKNLGSARLCCRDREC